MKPRTLFAESTTPYGASISLHEHDGAYSISFQRQELMHSKASVSELLLSKLLELSGRASFCSAGEDPHFKARMETVGFQVWQIRAKVYAGFKRAAYVI